MARLCSNCRYDTTAN